MMPSFALRFRLAVVSLLLAGFIPANAQSHAPATNSPSTNAAPAKPVTPIAIGDVVTESQSAAAKLKSVQSSTTPDVAAQAAQAEVDAAKQTIDKHVELDGALEQSAPTLDTLQSSQAAWQGITSSLDDIQRRLSDRVREQTSTLGELTTMAATWTATLQSAQTAKAPPATLQSIQATQAMIDGTTATVNGDLKSLYVLQRAAAAQSDRVDSGLDLLNRSITSAQARLRQQDQPQLWNPASFSGPGEGVVGRERATLTQQLSGVHSYLAAKIGSLLVQGILLGLLVATFCWIRNVVRERATTQSCLRDAERIFSAPYSTALLVTLLTSTWFYPMAESPRVLWSIVGIVALVPTVVIVRRLIAPELLPLLWVTVVTYLIDKVRMTATPDGAFARLVLLGEIVAACFFILGTLRLEVLSPAKNPARAERVLRVYLHVAYFAFLAAGFANVLGYGQLSVLIGSGMLKCSYTALIFYAAVRILDALVQAMMGMRPLSTFGAVRHHHDLVYEKTAQVIRWAAVGCWALSALWIFSLRNSFFARVDAALQTHLQWGLLDIQVGAVLAFPITVWAAFLLSRLIRFVMEEDVYPNLNLPRGIPYAISTVVHYAILVFGFFVALTAMGIHLGDYAVLAGAFGVGLGFGLQNIMNNFMSGLILLFERPVKVGDTVQFDAATMGRVERIGIRASVIVLTNGSELIVPNGNLISNPVTNWTLSNCERLIEIPVSIAPKTDTRRALETLTAAAKAHSAVLKNPPAQSVIAAFAAASTSLKLRCWIDAEEDWQQVTTDLILAIQAGLEKENIPLA